MTQSHDKIRSFTTIVTLATAPAAYFNSATYYQLEPTDTAEILFQSDFRPLRRDPMGNADEKPAESYPPILKMPTQQINATSTAQSLSTHWPV